MKKFIYATLFAIALYMLVRRSERVTTLLTTAITFFSNAWQGLTT